MLLSNPLWSLHPSKTCVTNSNSPCNITVLILFSQLDFKTITVQQDKKDLTQNFPDISDKKAFTNKSLLLTSQENEHPALCCCGRLITVQFWYKHTRAHPQLDAYLCLPGLRESSSTAASNSVRKSSRHPLSPKAPHSMLTHIRPSSPSTSSTFRISSM